jgi:hypothetical protein
MWMNPASAQVMPGSHQASYGEFHGTWFHSTFIEVLHKTSSLEQAIAAKSERGDVPGWVLVVLMTTGLVTGIWTVAQPRLSSILKNSLDNMNGIR